MAYPETSAHDVAQLQSENEQLRQLLMDFYTTAQMGVCIKTEAEQSVFAGSLLPLMHSAEELVPELDGEVEVDDDGGYDELEYEWAADHQE